jgi:hypothetical protein
MKASRILLFSTVLVLGPVAAQDPPLEPEPPSTAAAAFRSSDANNEFELTLQVAPLGGQALANDEFELILIEANPVPDPDIFASSFEAASAASRSLAHREDTP